MEKEIKLAIMKNRMANLQANGKNNTGVVRKLKREIRNLENNGKINR